MSAARGEPSPSAGVAADRASVSPAEARRELQARVRRRPGWALAAASAASLAGLAAIPQATLLARALDGAFLRGSGLPALARPLGLLLLVVALRALVEGLAALAGARAAAQVTTQLRAELSARLLDLGPAYLEQRRSGSLGTDVLEGVDRAAPVVARFLPQVVACGAVPVGIALYALALDPLSGIILVVTGPLIPLFMWLLGSLADQRAQRQWRTLALLGAQALDVLQSLETLRLFGREADHERALARVGERYRQTTLDVLRVAFLSGFALELLAMLGTAMVAVSVGLRLTTGGLGFQVALTTLLLAPEFYLPFRRLGAHHHAAMEGMAALRDVFGHLRAGPAFPTDAAEPRAAVPGCGTSPGADAPVRGRPTPGRHAAAPRASTLATPGPAPRVQLAGIWARYPGQATAALQGVSMELAPGGMTALVGASGAGKSSLARVLIGTLEPERGLVLVDGAPLEPARSPGWRARLAFVPQQPHLFAGTVLANLRLANSTASFAEVTAAARLAEADSFIRALPNGYTTPLGEDGVDLSGGERHRLAIARAFLRHAQVVVLDEISAYLDAGTEAAVARAVERLAERSTMLVIAHRLETVRLARHIVVLDGGRVIEQGSHGGLVAAGGAYATLARRAGAPPPTVAGP